MTPEHEYALMLQSVTQNVGFKVIIQNTLRRGNVNEHVECMKVDLSGSVQSPALKRWG
jgi:hypothetical protein